MRPNDHPFSALLALSETALRRVGHLGVVGQSGRLVVVGRGRRAAVRAALLLRLRGDLDAPVLRIHYSLDDLRVVPPRLDLLAHSQFLLDHTFRLLLFRPRGDLRCVVLQARDRLNDLQVTAPRLNLRLHPHP